MIQKMMVGVLFAFASCAMAGPLEDKIASICARYEAHFGAAKTVGGRNNVLGAIKLECEKWFGVKSGAPHHRSYEGFDGEEIDAILVSLKDLFAVLNQRLAPGDRRFADIDPPWYGELVE